MDKVPMKRSILRNERQKRNLTMKQVSQDVGIGVTHYAKIEHGTGNPSFPLACKFQKYFGIDACALLKRDEEKGM